MEDTVSKGRPHCLLQRFSAKATFAASTTVLMYFVSFSNALAQDASKLFEEKCAGCHTIGGGELVGPDLAPTAGWNTIELTKSVKSMEKSAGSLSAPEIESLVEYLRKSNR